jgi:hypothetical protein
MAQVTARLAELEPRAVAAPELADFVAAAFVPAALAPADLSRLRFRQTPTKRPAPNHRERVHDERDK